MIEIISKLAPYVFVAIMGASFGFYIGMSFEENRSTERDERYQQTIKQLRCYIEEQKNNPPKIEVVTHKEDNRMTSLTSLTFIGSALATIAAFACIDKKRRK